MSPKESEKITNAYKKEHNRLLGYIRRRIPGYVEAEDILQDVFYQLTVGFNDIRRLENRQPGYTGWPITALPIISGRSILKPSATGKKLLMVRKVPLRLKRFFLQSDPIPGMKI